MTPHILASLRRAVPACTLVVWADIGKGTVLAADGNLAYPQEYLDALADCAALLLHIPGPGTEGGARSAVFVGPTGSRIFFGMPDAPSEALCCLCSPVADAGALLETIRSVMIEATRSEAAA
jgi:hypothetical protein